MYFYVCVDKEAVASKMKEVFKKYEQNMRVFIDLEKDLILFKEYVAVQLRCVENGFSESLTSPKVCALFALLSQCSYNRICVYVCTIR